VYDMRTLMIHVVYVSAQLNPSDHAQHTSVCLLNVIDRRASTRALLEIIKL